MMTDYWKENNIEKPQSVIVCAACKFMEFTICGARHWDKIMNKQLRILQFAYPESDIKSTKFKQGFVDQFGEFHTRKDAMTIVKLSGQPFNAERNSHDTFLFSEGLY